MAATETAATEVALNRARIKELRELAKSRRKLVRNPEYGEVVESIPILASLADSSDASDAEDVYGVLIDECVRSGRPDLEIAFRRRVVNLFPQEPILICSLAAALANNPETRDESIAWSEKAIAVAAKTNRFVRYALTTRLRLALARGDYAAVNRLLLELVADSQLVREDDYVFEVDFVDLLDEDRVDQDVLRRYLEIVSRDEGTSGSSNH